jgi:hypothetical protein
MLARILQETLAGVEKECCLKSLDLGTARAIAPCLPSTTYHCHIANESSGCIYHRISHPASYSQHCTQSRPCDMSPSDRISLYPITTQGFSSHTKKIDTWHSFNVTHLLHRLSGKGPPEPPHTPVPFEWTVYTAANHTLLNMSGAHQPRTATGDD